MRKLIVNIKTSKQEYLNISPEEETQRLAEIAQAELEYEKEQAKEQKRKDALERLKTSVNSEVLDILEVLNLTD